jgi:cell division protein FtsQ
VLIALLLLVGLGLTGRVLLYDMGLADVEDVQVTSPGAGGTTSGSPIVPVDAVLAAAAVTRGAPLAAVDTGAVYPGPASPGLPRFTFRPAGPDDPATRAAVSVLTALPEALRSQVLTVDATDTAPDVPGQVTLGLTENRQVQWGSPDRSGEKAAVLVPLLTQRGQVYDVTSPDLPTIKR